MACCSRILPIPGPTSLGAPLLCSFSTGLVPVGLLPILPLPTGWDGVFGYHRPAGLEQT
jgi:hypothetical protein